MIVYCVSILIDSEIAEDWLSWMRQVHIPDVLSTGCFRSHQFFEEVIRDGSSQRRFQIQYLCDSENVLAQYQAEHASALQADHTARYSGRFQASRVILKKIEDSK